MFNFYLCGAIFYLSPLSSLFHLSSACILYNIQYITSDIHTHIFAVYLIARWQPADLQIT